MWTSRPDGGPDRLLALADGVFAIAITLLVLDLYVPRGLEPDEYREALRRVLPDLGAYALSVAVLGSFWRDHRRIFRGVREVDGQVIILSVLGLGVAALVPFPTRLLAEYGDRPVSVAVYAGAVAALGACHLAVAAVLAKRPWLRHDTPAEAATTLYLLDSATIVVVFLVTVPLVFVTGPTIMWLWLVLVPAKGYLGRRHQAHG
ncbi:TMEM175 family protein [Streptomyces sp. 378]|uniref:TMEM175 family protein n=1 Tax=Streptomyces sp. 378 TaxID=3049412 RepID=UPI0024C41ED9|nr:TMEM175 family protein [Streptomyces sp. 378]MDK1342586.1 TMEM175 family protein [Streptomyces sp. 378]